MFGRRDDLDAGKGSKRISTTLALKCLIGVGGSRLMAGSDGNKLIPMGPIRRRVGEGKYTSPNRLNDCKGVGSCDVARA